MNVLFLISSSYHIWPTSGSLERIKLERSCTNTTHFSYTHWIVSIIFYSFTSPLSVNIFFCIFLIDRWIAIRFYPNFIGCNSIQFKSRSIFEDDAAVWLMNRRHRQKNSPFSLHTRNKKIQVGWRPASSSWSHPKWEELEPSPPLEVEWIHKDFFRFYADVSNHSFLYRYT